MKGSHTYAAPIVAVLDTLRDRGATVEKYEGMGHHHAEVLECDEREGASLDELVLMGEAQVPPSA